MTYQKSDVAATNRTGRPIPAEGIGRRIAALADRVGTRKYAASVAGVSADALQRYIREENAPSFEVGARLCLAAGARMEWLATEEEPMLVVETAPQSQSQATRLDPETIVAAVKLLSWAFELQDAVYDPAKDPDLLADTYAFLMEHDGKVTPDNLVDFSKRLAEKRAKEAGRA